jgi:hypothetical protein
MDFDRNAASDRDRPHIAVLKFWIEYEETKAKIGEPVEVHWAEWVKKGGNGATTCEKVSRLKKDQVLWPSIERSYEAWLKGQEEPVSGTALSAWPGVHTAQADRLKLMHIRTVEDVAAMTDADLDKIGMGARALRDKARAFIQAKQGEAQIAAALSERDATIAAQSAELEELRATVDALAAKAGLEKRGPGRPRNAA